MNKILFRGKTIEDFKNENGKIVPKGSVIYGSPVYDSDFCYMIRGAAELMDDCLHIDSWVRVDPDSVELVANTPLPKHICYILEAAGTRSRGIRKAGGKK